MRLFDSVINTCMLSHIAIGEMYVFKFCPGLIIYSPAHDVHNGCITEGSAALQLQLKLSAMVCLMTGLTKSNKVIWHYHQSCGSQDCERSEYCRHFSLCNAGTCGHPLQGRIHEHSKNPSARPADIPRLESVRS